MARGGPSDRTRKARQYNYYFDLYLKLGNEVSDENKETPHIAGRCGGYRSAMSHNICFLNFMFVFVTFAYL